MLLQRCTGHWCVAGVSEVAGTRCVRGPRREKKIIVVAGKWRLIDWWALGWGVVMRAIVESEGNDSFAVVGVP